MHGMMGNVPTPIVAMTMYAQNVMDTIGSPIAGVTHRRCLIVETQKETEKEGTPSKGCHPENTVAIVLCCVY